MYMYKQETSILVISPLVQLTLSQLHTGLPQYHDSGLLYEIVLANSHIASEADTIGAEVGGRTGGSGEAVGFGAEGLLVGLEVGLEVGIFDFGIAVGDCV